MIILLCSVEIAPENFESSKIDEVLHHSVYCIVGTLATFTITWFGKHLFLKMRRSKVMNLLCSEFRRNNFVKEHCKILS